MRAAASIAAAAPGVAAARRPQQHAQGLPQRAGAARVGLVRVGGAAGSTRPREAQPGRRARGRSVRISAPRRSSAVLTNPSTSRRRPGAGDRSGPRWLEKSAGSGRRGGTERHQHTTNGGDPERWGKDVVRASKTLPTEAGYREVDARIHRQPRAICSAQARQPCDDRESTWPASRRRLPGRRSGDPPRLGVAGHGHDVAPVPLGCVPQSVADAVAAQVEADEERWSRFRESSELEHLNRCAGSPPR